MVKLDIDRLHKVFHGELNYRGCGITTAVCYQALGFAQVQNKKVFIITSISKHIENVKSLLKNCLNEQNILWGYKNNGDIITVESEVYPDDFINEIIICSLDQYEFKYQYGTCDHIILFDFVEGYYQGFNSAQSTWDDIVNAEQILWSQASGIKVTHF